MPEMPQDQILLMSSRERVCRTLQKGFIYGVGIVATGYAAAAGLLSFGILSALALTGAGVTAWKEFGRHRDLSQPPAGIRGSQEDTRYKKFLTYLAETAGIRPPQFILAESGQCFGTRKINGKDLPEIGFAAHALGTDFIHLVDSPRHEIQVICYLTHEFGHVVRGDAATNRIGRLTAIAMPFQIAVASFCMQSASLTPTNSFTLLAAGTAALAVSCFTSSFQEFEAERITVDLLGTDRPPAAYTDTAGMLHHCEQHELPVPPSLEKSADFSPVRPPHLWRTINRVCGVLAPPLTMPRPSFK